MQSKFTNYRESANKPLKYFPVKRSPADRLKNKVIDVASDIMSYPARRKAQKSMIRDEENLRDIKMVREAKGTDTSDKDHHDPLFRARANVSNFKSEQEVALRKQNK